VRVGKHPASDGLLYQRVHETRTKEAHPLALI
jgi:hypothetical protein